MLDLNLDESSQFSLSPATRNAMHSYRLAIHRIMIVGSNKMRRINRQARHHLLFVLHLPSERLRHSRHGIRRNRIIERAIRILEMAVLIIFKHLLAERIARSTHKEGSLQAKLLLILLVESGKAILWKNLIKTTMQIDIAIHIDAAFLIYGIESHHIGSESPLSGLQGRCARAFVVLLLRFRESQSS